MSSSARDRPSPVPVGNSPAVVDETALPVAATRRILFLSPFFFPESIGTGRYNTWLIRRLGQSGAHVEVVASYPLYPAWRPQWSDAGITTAIVHRGGLYVRYPSSTVGRRLVLELWFGLFAIVWSVRLRHRVDTVVVASPPGLFVAFLRLLLPRTVRLVCIVHDLQEIMALSTENWFRRAVARTVGAGERRVIAACDKVICLSESMRQAIVTRYGVARDKCEVHYPFPTLTGGAEGRRDLEKFFPQGFHHIVYAGALGEKQRPLELIEFFGRLCRKRNDVMCHVFSAGAHFEGMKRDGGRSEFSRVMLHDLVPDENLTELYERSTIQVVPQARGTEAGAFPSKVPNLLLAGVPIFGICAKESELAAILRESQSGVSAQGTDLDIWVDDMIKFLDRVTVISRDVFRGRAKPYVVKKFSLGALVASILKS